MKRCKRLALVAGVGLLACGSPNGADNTPAGPSSGGQVNGAGTGATNTQSGSSGSGVSTGGATVGGATVGGATVGGATTGGVATSGSGGATAGTNSAGSGGTAAGSGGTLPGGGAGGSGGGDPVANPLNITAAPALHTHPINGRQAGVDTRLPKVVGKLIVNIDVDDGGIYDYGITHGFHVWGGAIFHCNIAQAVATYASQGRDFNGNCRWETLDGVDHDPSLAVAPADAIMGKLKQALTDLAKTFPEEGWAYFLAADGSVRWSDVGFTGYSHGASSSIRWAKKLNVWRAVGRSGPRDNICGQFPAGKCPDADISSWLDEPSATPIENMYGLTGTQDSEYKDIVFAMERMKFVGALVDINSTAPPYNGSHRLQINGGHDPFTDKKFWPAMDVIWATPAEDVAYANSH